MINCVSSNDSCSMLCEHVVHNDINFIKLKHEYQDVTYSHHLIEVTLEE